ncbi:MAG: hypothetical protein ABIU87_10390 [Ornithinibacter sp.]
MVAQSGKALARAQSRVEESDDGGALAWPDDDLEHLDRHTRLPLATAQDHERPVHRISAVCHGERRAHAAGQQLELVGQGSEQRTVSVGWGLGVRDVVEVLEGDGRFENTHGAGDVVRHHETHRLARPLRRWPGPGKGAQHREPEHRVLVADVGGEHPVTLSGPCHRGHEPPRTRRVPARQCVIHGRQSGITEPTHGH